MPKRRKVLKGMSADGFADKLLGIFESKLAELPPNEQDAKSMHSTGKPLTLPAQLVPQVHGLNELSRFLSRLDLANRGHKLTQSTVRIGEHFTGFPEFTPSLN